MLPSTSSVVNQSSARYHRKSDISKDEGEKPPWPVKEMVLLVISGYLSAILLILLWYAVHPNLRTEITGNWWTFVLLVLFCMSLFYCRSFRCVMALSLPTLCSSRGRTLIVAFAFFVVATGPTVNIINNIEVLTRSLSCGQIQMMEALGHMLDVFRQPLLSVQRALAIVLDELRKVMQNVETVMVHIKDLVFIILATFRNCANWLTNVVRICNKEFGTPFEHCMKTAGIAMKKCKQKLGRFNSLCHVTDIFRIICHSAKIVDVFCDASWQFNDRLLSNFMANFERFIQEIEQLFKVSISFEHEYHFETNATKNLTEVSDEIVKIIQSRMHTFLMVFGWLHFVGTILTCTVILKAVYFRMRYLHSKRYKNIYITGDFYEVDNTRQLNNQETVLPLKRLESWKYIKLTSWRLTKSEFLLMARSSLFMLITCIQLLFICFTDYCLYWLLAMISYHGHLQAGLEVPAYIKIDVKGGGFVADVIRGVVSAFEPMTKSYTIDTLPCLPKPHRPNYWRYFQIATLCLFSWILLIVEPYGLRTRFVIMRWFYPDETRERAVFLYNKILTNRVSFFKFARRKARSLFRYKDPYSSDLTLLKYLRTKLARLLCCPSFCDLNAELCIICATSLNGGNRVRCETPGCKGVYCQNCYKDSKKMCCLCKRPAEYGDHSDISEVRDSSDGEDCYSAAYESWGTGRIAYKKIP